jgi:hypothetical protein
MADDTSNENRALSLLVAGMNLRTRGRSAPTQVSGVPMTYEYIADLMYAVEVFDARPNLIEILARLHDLHAARAASPIEQNKLTEPDRQRRDEACSKTIAKTAPLLSHLCYRLSVDGYAKWGWTYKSWPSLSKRRKVPRSY